jgi:3',5'-cyclic AMP phosphodiesterase CpdA
MTLSPAIGISWLIIALFATTAQYLMLPVAGTDQSVSASILVGLAVIFLAPLAATVLAAVSARINERMKGKRLACAVSILGIVLYAAIMLAIVASPLLYFLHVTNEEFGSYPASRELPVEKAGIASTCDSPSVLAVISDTHITDLPRTLEKKEHGDAKLRRMLEAVRNACPKLLIVSGDLTDQGERPEWERFRALIRESGAATAARGAAPQLVIVPGNHDLQGTPFTQGGEILTRGFARTQDEHFYSVLYLGRKRSFLELADAERMLAHVAVKSSVPAEFSRRVDEVLAAAAKKVRVMTDPGSLGGAASPGRTRPSFAYLYPEGFRKMLEAAQKEFDDLFPMIYENAQPGLTLVLLNSSAHLSPGASMGLGSLGAAQMKRLEDYLSKLGAAGNPPRSLVVVLHHAPVRRAIDAWSWRELKEKVGDSSIWAHTVLALDVDDAQKLVSLIDGFARSRRDVQVVLVHGHRHGAPYLGETGGGVLIVEAPGTIEDHSAGYWAADWVAGKLAFKWRPVQ